MQQLRKLRTEMRGFPRMEMAKKLSSKSVKFNKLNWSITKGDHSKGSRMQQWSNGKQRQTLTPSVDNMSKDSSGASNDTMRQEPKKVART